MLDNFEEKGKKASTKIAKMLEDSPWISKDEEYFGKEGTMYDFKDLDPLQLNQQI